MSRQTPEWVPKDGGPVGFVFAEVFTFGDGRISRVETFHLNVSGAGDNVWTVPSG